MTPAYINPLQWNQALGYARQACARVFRDGGRPEDALAAFGLTGKGAKADGITDWSKAVEAIAQVMCAQTMKQAA